MPTLSSEYFAFTAKVELLYLSGTQPGVMPAEAAGPNLAAQRNEATKRFLIMATAASACEHACRYDSC